MSRVRRSREAVALAAEALAWLSLASGAVRLVPFPWLTWMASRPLGPTRPAADVARAVKAASRRAPWPVACFEEALAAQIMLRRRGVGSTLYYGLAADGPRGVAGHVWVRQGADPVIGCEMADRFAVVGVFPPPTAGEARPAGA